ncbi:bifunctional diguanylate cyclase/phosphodiesterase [Candidatus Photodesmus anomalopis]|uniref:Diguanylate cyclase n=1 Tax=Candidatus Photodesmus katoptron Akat1 TaxID=1236703 RepID=S3E030_9GAMM|nr:cache domain-containing protein [Candidatus Photodesmus katoptron]EPE37571.1 diguanylate cyclase [Candidatus Photodesmus katoptron Akat1]
MDVFTDKKLIKLVRYSPLFIVSVFISVLVTILVHNNQKNTHDLVTELRSDYILSRKLAIKQKVDAIVDKIEYEQKQTVQILKQNIHSRVLEAHQIATNIYINNKNQTKHIISKNIYDALSSIRFNEKRGYFFIFTMDGVSVLHPLIPRMEGKSQIELKDIHGTPILKEHIELIKKSKNNQAFYRWWFKKPGHDNKEFEKIGFGKYFEPYNWFIGTGEYVSDVENSIKNNLLNWLSNYSFEDDSFIMVLNNNANILSYFKQNLIGKKWRYADLSQYQQIPENQGEFFEIQKMKSDKSEIYYIHNFSQWGWFLVNSFPLSKIDSYLIDKETNLIAEGKGTLYKILIACTIFALVLSLISLWIGNYINRRFYDFQHKIQDSFARLKQSQHQLEYLAHHDSLTGLANRVKLSYEIERAIALCDSTKTMLSVMFVDIDNFKKINDQYGHKVGDEFIKLISRKIKAITGKNDIVARFGGDEFIVCFSLVKNEHEIKSKSDKLLSLFNESIILNGVQMKVSSSIGIATYPKDGSNEQELISKSDIVLYRTKEKCKGTALFYNDDINQQVQYQFLLEDELTSALQNNEINVVYQPQIDSATGQLKAVEALCRWNNNKLGLIPAEQFIPIAETKGLISSIGDYVFAQSCLDIHRFYLNYNQSIGLSINVSPIQLLEPNFPLKLKNLAEQFGISKKILQLKSLKMSLLRI